MGTVCAATAGAECCYKYIFFKKYKSEIQPAGRLHTPDGPAA